MPGVLIELGFLSNVKEAKFLKSAQGQDYMASAIYRAIRDYLQVIEKENIVEEIVEVEGDQVEEIVPIYYRVQFATYKKEKKKKFRKFKNLKDVLYYKVDNLYKYTTGNDTSYQEMLKWKDEVRNLGFKDAFIIAMKEGKRIPLKEARKK
jgi:N-acetylmuramoyl-L-alanine amidase